jgi:glycosyltransferase involved in cell wall biosynthesis
MTNLTEGNRALRNKNYETAISLYLQTLQISPDLGKIITSNLAMARRKYRTVRKSKIHQRVAVCGWDLAHYAAGRVYTLANLYQTFAETEIIGSFFPKLGRELSEPLRSTKIPIHSFVVEDEKNFLDQAVQLVAAHPYDIIHLSNPRISNIFIGILYKLIWDAKVLVDIDGEELALAGADSSIILDDYFENDGRLPALINLPGKDWTRHAVGLVKEFDGVTVSSPALQQRYGGEIICHTLDEKIFNPSPELKCKNRKKYGIPQDKKIVIIFENSRQYKGLIEAAEAVSGLNREEIFFFVICAVPEPTLKNKLQAITGVNFIFIGNQSLETVAEVAAIGDVCLFLQDLKAAAGQLCVQDQLDDASRISELLRVNSQNIAHQLVNVLNDSKIRSLLQTVGPRYFLSELFFAENRQHLQQTTIQYSNQPLTAPAERLAKTLGDSFLDAIMHILKPKKYLPVVLRKFALIIHAFHLDVLDDLAMHVANFPKHADQFVTFPEDFSDEKRAKIKMVFPNATGVAVPNAGQDVGALFSLMDSVDLSQYGFICKIHTKKGKKKPREWRFALLRGVLGSQAQVKRTIEHFQTDPDVKLVGPRQLYLHGPSNLWLNAGNIRNMFNGIVKDFNFTSRDWGFFAGTCFWIRTDILGMIRDHMRRVKFEIAAYVDDGATAHAVERMFGMLTVIMSGKTILNDVVALDARSVEIKNFPSNLPRERVSIVSLLESLALPTSVVTSPAEPKSASPPKIELATKKLQIRGSLDLVKNRSEIHGWLAQIGNATPRKAIVRIDGDTNLTIVATAFRLDLQNHGINKGKHAFFLTVPSAFMDGKLHDLALIDGESGLLIERKPCSWDRPKREYFDFQGFLRSSMTQPVVQTPFTEEDKRSFAMMENIANRLCCRSFALSAPPLVSVIMPVYNREKIVSISIRSVLEQEYRNFELIVVDDGSTDQSVAVVESFSDDRIRLLKQPANAGHSAARNAGLRAAQGEIIIYLDSDNTWDNRYVAAIVGAFDSIPDADAVYSGQLLYRGQSTEPFAARYGHFNRALLENKNFVDLNAFAHRRTLLERANGFDESLKRFVDYDLILRMSEQGKIYSVPILLCHYFYDKAADTVTNDVRHIADMAVLRNQLQARTRERLQIQDKADLDRHVTAVIPNWQSLEDIRDCLNSLSAGDLKGMLDIIVVDNASDQEVLAYLRAEAVSGRIKLIENQRNFGFTYAVNQGIALARQESDVLLMNNDAIVQGGAVAALQRACYSLPDAGMTVPRQILPAGTKTLLTHVPYADELIDCDVNISAHHRNIAAVPLFHNGGTLELSYAPFFCVYIRRDIINDLGTLDAEYGRHYRSDRVFCDLMRNVLGRKLYYVPEAFVIHKLQKATETLRDTGQRAKEFELMYLRNQWDAESYSSFGFRQAPWDIF